jgi:hypothetical protein
MQTFFLQLHKMSLYIQLVRTGNSTLLKNVHDKSRLLYTTKARQRRALLPTNSKAPQRHDVPTSRLKAAKRRPHNL